MERLTKYQDMEEGGDVLEDADREADLLEQVPLPGHPESEKECLASWLRLPRRARVAIRLLHRNLGHLPREALVQMLRAVGAPQDFFSVPPRPLDARDATTQSLTSALFVQSRSGSRCVRDR